MINNNFFLSNNNIFLCYNNIFLNNNENNNFEKNIDKNYEEYFHQQCKVAIVIVHVTLSEPNNAVTRLGMMVRMAWMDGWMDGSYGMDG